MTTACSHDNSETLPKKGLKSANSSGHTPLYFKCYLTYFFLFLLAPKPLTSGSEPVSEREIALQDDVHGMKDDVPSSLRFHAIFLILG